MASLILLDANTIEKQLKKNITSAFKLHVFSSIDSTNHYLKTVIDNTSLQICVAESQTQGRGRFGRPWHSPYAENIYCSSRWTIPINQCAGLSLIVSLAIVEVLEQLNIPDLQIKWPNDILWREKKLSGILIELLDVNQVIIGIGLNVNSDTLNNPLSDKIWCSLYEIIGRYSDRNVIITLLIIQLELYIQQFIHSGLHEFIEKWQKYDYLINKFIRIQQAERIIEGTCLGINKQGELLLIDGNHIIHTLYSGETSIIL